MRHKAPRPLADSWRRLPAATARLLDRAAGERPFHALVAVVVTMSLGAGAYVALSPASGGSPTEPSLLAGSTPPGGSAPPSNAEPTGSGVDPTAAGSTSSGSSAPGSTGQPGTTVPPSTGLTSEPATRTGPETGSPSTGAPSAPSTPSTPSTSDTSEAPNTPSPPSAGTSTAPVDVTPPDTRVVSEEVPEADGGEFWLSATEPATFVCSLDAAAYTPCTSHVVLSDLDPGWHTLAVRATDAAGNADPSPAVTSWVATKSSPSDD